MVSPSVDLLAISLVKCLYAAQQSRNRKIAQLLRNLTIAALLPSLHFPNDY